MRTSLRAVLAAATVLAVAQPALASPPPGPSATARVATQRELSFEAASGWDRLSMSFQHTRGSVTAGTVSGGAGGERWDACVYSSARAGWFSSCSTPTGVTFDFPPGSATGRIKFTMRESYGSGSAVVDLTLTETAATPTVSYELAPYATSVAPGLTTSRLATLKGVVRVTTTRYGTTKPATKTYALSGIPVYFRDRVLTSVRVYPGV